MTATHPSDPADGYAAFRYQPYYCDENAWWLCAEPVLGAGPRHVIFIVNQHGACPVAAQRAAPPGALCWWDYHVVVLDAARRIWDLDTRLGLPVAALDWLHGSFPAIDRLPAQLAPLFRVVPAADYRRDFASDRSHMRTPAGGWLQPPPPWPIIGRGMNLHAYRSTAPGGPGRLTDAAQLIAWLPSAAT